MVNWRINCDLNYRIYININTVGKESIDNNNDHFGTYMANIQ